MSSPDPKPATRVRLDRRAYAELVAEAFAQTRGLCACGCGRRADSLHHLAGGNDRDDRLEAVVPLAGDGTRLCHGALTSGNNTYDYAPVTRNGGMALVCRPNAVRAAIREALEERFPEKLAYLLDRKGEAWLDAAYPRL